MRRGCGFGAVAVLAVMLGGCGHKHVAVIPANQDELAGLCSQVRSAAVGRFVRESANGRYVASESSADQAEPFHLQATGPGTFLLYGSRGEFLRVGSGGVVRSAARPSTNATWRLFAGPAGKFTLASVGAKRVLVASAPSGALGLANVGSAGPAADFTFQPATGCARYPEAGVGASGSTFAGVAPTAEVLGTIDAHAHITAFDFLGGHFHCGRPWAPFGVAAALPDCTFQGPHGILAPIQNFLDWGAPFQPHHTLGWPTFVDWPGPDRLSYEGDYYTGIKRAWMAGLRLIVTQYVDNEALCFLMEGHTCDDMASVRQQNRDLHDLQDYIDAQAGGPGQGFFQIVTNPFQARRVINEGKLAVVEGIEVSDVLGCGGRGRPGCTDARIAARLDEIQHLGVSTFFPIHKFDNAVGGTKMDVGSTGLLINIANHFETGHFWDVQACPGGPSTQERDSQQLNNQRPGGVLQTMINVVFWPLGPSPPITGVSPPHCNGLGLSPSGAYVINEMIRRHLIVEIDHMDVKTADAALSVIEGRHYSGVVSAHSWDTPADNKRIYAVGGLVTPSGQGVPGNFVRQWRIDRADPRAGFRFGFGYGSDMNGLSHQDQATSGGPGKEKIVYPFKSFDGKVTFRPEQWGFKTFNIDTNGVANYGLYADWLEAVRVNAGADGQAIMGDMFNGAEGYLQMWERAYGVPAARCLSAHLNFTAAGLGTAVLLGDAPEQLLPRSGQPSSRPGRSYRFCAGSAGAATGSVSALFAPDNSVGLIAATAPGVAAGGLRPGLPETLLKGRAALQSAGLWLGPKLPSGARYLYGTSSGRITYVGLAQPQETSSATHLREELRQAGL